MDPPVSPAPFGPPSRLPAGLYGRVLALRGLADLERAVHTVMERGDNDAFHLIHSALSRICTVLREFGPWPDEVAPARPDLALFHRRTRRLRELVRDLALLEALSSVGGTDIQELEWALAGFRWRSARLAESLAGELEADLLPALPPLREALSHASVRVGEDGLGDGPSGRLRALARGWALQDALVRLLDAVLEDPRGRGVLRARVHTARLLVLLGPLADEGHGGARSAVGALPRLHELLEALESVGRLRERLRTLLARGSSKEVKAWRALQRQQALQPVFAALDARERDLLGALRRGRDSGRWSDRIRIDPREAVRAAPDPPAAPPPDVPPGHRTRPARAEGGPDPRERRMLLRALPPIPPEVEPIRIVEGWLPEDPAVARLRIVEPPEGPARRTRILRGSAPDAAVREDQPPDEVFDALWPLTDRCRLRRLRWRIPDGESIWLVDSMPALPLLVARAAVPEGSAGPPIPDWLAPVVVREITGEDGWEDEELARRGPPPGGLHAPAPDRMRGGA